MTEENTHRVLLRTHYRSLTAEGRTWCESKDPDEVLHRSTMHNAVAEGPMTYQRLEILEVTDGWQPWNPTSSEGE